MTEIVFYIVAGVLLLGATVGMNSCANKTAQARCEEKGGEYYQAIDPGHSLCKLPK